MVDFVDCYFCGTVADDLEQHPVIPPELDPPDDSQRRVVVCPTCREKLDRVIEPVLAYADASSVSSDTGSETTEDEGYRLEREENDQPGPFPDDDHETAVREGTEADPEAVGDEAATMGNREDAEAMAEETEGGPGADGSGEESTPEEDEEADVDLPPEANQILRLLGNREFPVDREEIVAVATNAYDVRRAEAEAVLDALAENDRLREEDGTLYRRD